MVPEPDSLDPTPGPRRVARRTVALGLATVLVLSAGAWVAADELGYLPSSDPEPAAAEAAASPSPAAVAEATPTPTPEPATPEPMVSDDPLDEILVSEPQPGGGGRNVVKVENWIDSNLAVKASIELNRITKKRAEPVNFARAYSSCTGCKTIAVALQINLIAKDIRQVAPWNAAVALNERCNSCVTVALAYQLTISVDDPKDTPKDVRDLVKEMDRELRAISNDQSIDVIQAATRLDAVIARYETLKASLIRQRAEAQEETTPDLASAPTEPPATAEPSADASGEPAEPAPAASDSPAVADSPEPAPTPSP
jgi:putative peptide zinc metalloprotease protein